MHLLAACSIVLAVHMQPGSYIVEHSTYDDRVAWVLPPDKLAAFARSGVVINEDKLTRVVAVATVTSTLRNMMTLNGNIDTTVNDVPRHRTQHDNTALAATVTPRNDPLPARPLDLEESAMVDLPVTHLCVGQSWRTRVPVATTLGSGIASIVHTVVSTNGSMVEIDVKGDGAITGVEYNLPHLLPGSFSISGKAWFDVVGGIVTQESYVVRNRLIRTVREKTIGFIETETVDVTTHVGSPTAAFRPDPHKTR